jgi:hypothetical protein
MRLRRRRQSAKPTGHTAAPSWTTFAPGIPADRHPRDLSEPVKSSPSSWPSNSPPRPDVVLLDEPTRGLDYPAKTALATRHPCARWRPTAIRSSISTHDVEFVADCRRRGRRPGRGRTRSPTARPPTSWPLPPHSPRNSPRCSPPPRLLTVAQAPAGAAEAGDSSYDRATTCPTPPELPARRHIHRYPTPRLAPPWR